MLIKYIQATGHLYLVESDGTEELLFVGWAGRGLGKNNPEMQTVRSTGPLPVGLYRITGPENNPLTGPLSLRLTPDPETQMYGRDGFLIHGAASDPAKRGQESKGCIIASRATREKIISLGVSIIEVVSV